MRMDQGHSHSAMNALGMGMTSRLREHGEHEIATAKASAAMIPEIRSGKINQLERRY